MSDESRSTEDAEGAERRDPDADAAAPEPAPDPALKADPDPAPKADTELAPKADPEPAPKADQEPAAPPVAAASELTAIGPKPSVLFLAVVSILSLAADLGSKAWAKSYLDDPKVFGGRKVSVIGEHISFIFARNRGGAWGLLQDESESVRKPFFLMISVAAIAFIVMLYRRVTPQQIALKWGLPLVLGGALGNLVDRIRYGFVVDFIDVRVTRDFRWPTFNIADIAIVVGVGLMAIDMFTSRKSDAAATPAPLQPAPEPELQPAPAPETKSEP